MPEPRDVITGDYLPPGPLQLADHQRRIIDEALSKTEKGLFKYSTIIYSAPKKSGKSAVASAVNLYMADQTPYARCYCLANDGKQSSDRIYGPIHTCLQLHNRLGGKFKGVVANKTEVILPNMAKIEAIPVDPSGEAGGNPTIVTFCYDDQTEVLTKSGWKGVESLSEGDIVATLSAKGMFEWQPALQVHVYDYDGLMYEVDHQKVNFMVTPNHRMYGKFIEDETRASFDQDKWQIKKAEEACQYRKYYTRMACSGWFGEEYKGIYLPATARKPERHISPELSAKFLGWFLSEGCVYYKRGIPQAVMIGVSSSAYPENYKELKALITDLGYVPRQWVGNESLVIHDSQLAAYCSQFGKAEDKYIPEDLKESSQEILRLFFDAYVKGDGWEVKLRKTEKAIFIGTISVSMVDDLLEVGQKLGYHVSSYEYKDKRSRFLQYKVAFFDGCSGEKAVGILRKQWKTAQYRGKVFCPSTQNGVVLIRRKGQVHWQGQSELWGYDTDIKKRFFTEMTVPPTLYGRAIRWIETYAGFVGISDLLWNLYQRGINEGQRHPDFPDLPVYVNQEAGMFVYWDHEPRMIWQTPEYYSSEASILSFGEFERIHRNRWVSPTESFVDRGAWLACADTSLIPLNDKKTPAIIAIDAAVSHDCAAAVLVTRDPKYPETDIAIRGFRVWKPENGKILLEQTIGKTIQEWGQKYNIVCITYDPYQMEKLAQDYSRGIVIPPESETRGMTNDEILKYKEELRRAVMCWYKPFNQNNERSVADKRLYDMIVAKQIHYNPEGNDPIAENGDEESLTKHITQAGSSGKADKYRLVKLAENAKIDGAVALSMATHVCMSLNLHNKEYDESDLVRRYDRGDVSFDQMIDGFRRRNARVRVE